MDAKKFGAFIAQCRKEKGMKQVELAQKLHVSDKAISRWERGVGFPDINSIEKLAQALDISIVELMRSERMPADAVNKDTEDAVYRTVEILQYQRNQSRRKCVMATLCYLAAVLFGIGIVAVNVEHTSLVLGYLLVMLGTGYYIIRTLLDLYRGSDYYRMEMEGQLLSAYRKKLKTVSIVFLMIGVAGLLRYGYFLIQILFFMEPGAQGREILIESMYWALGKSSLDVFCGIIGIQVVRTVFPGWTAILTGVFYFVVTIVRQFYDFAILEVLFLILPLLMMTCSYKIRKNSTILNIE